MDWIGENFCTSFTEMFDRSAPPFKAAPGSQSLSLRTQLRLQCKKDKKNQSGWGLDMLQTHDVSGTGVKLEQDIGQCSPLFKKKKPFLLVLLVLNWGFGSKVKCT